MMVERGLRVAAVAIAIAALTDPVVTRDAEATQALSIAVIEPATVEAVASAGRLRSALASDYTVSVRAHPREATASACPSEGGCIVISQGTMPNRLTAGADVIGAVRVRRW